MKLVPRFWRHMPLRKQVVVGFIFPIVVVGALSLVVAQNIDEARGLSHDAQRSIREVAVRGELLTAVLNAETGERGYVITGDRAFLQPYAHARSQFAKAVQDWRALDKDGTDAHLGQLEHLFERWLTEVAEPAIAARGRSPGQLYTLSFEALYRVLQIRHRVVNDRLSELDDDFLLGYQMLLSQAVRVGSGTREADLWLRAADEGERLTDSLARLRDAGTLGNSVEQGEAQQAAERLAQQLLELTRIARLGETEATQIVSSGRGMALVEEIRQLVAQAVAEQEQDHAQLASASRQRLSLVRILTMTLPAVSVGVGLTILLLMQLDVIRSIERIRLGARKIEGGDLQARIEEERTDEIGLLGRGFNRMAERLQQADRQATLFDGYQSMLVSSTSEEEAYHAARRAFTKIIPRVNGALYILAPSRDFAERALSWGAAETLVERFHPEECRALRMGRNYRASKNSTELFCPHTAGISADCSVCIPLVTRDEMLGVVFLWAGPEHSAEFAAQELMVANAISERLALTLNNLRLTEKLRRESVRDPLTGLFNRRYFEETFGRELSRVKRDSKPMAIIALDVDHFKRFNDSFGHDAGDLVLKELAAKMVSVVRPSDIACRFGGEEFIIVLPEAGRNTALQRAEELRIEVEKLRLSYDGKSLGTFTISLGVAVYPEHSLEKNELVRLADTALYAAKRQGRNRVVMTGEESSGTAPLEPASESHPPVS